jgi:hypothetical protein
VGIQSSSCLPGMGDGHYSALSHLPAARRIQVPPPRQLVDALYLGSGPINFIVHE